MKLRFLSHAGFIITTEGGKKILLDPFLDNNPLAPIKSDQVSADYIIITHGHGDHLGDALKIADKNRTLFICVNELANYVAGKGFKAHNMHIGGSHKFPFGRVKFTIAHHGSMTPDNHYGGEASGVILTIEEKSIYHTGDTGLFYDMKLIGEMTPVDYMLLPIGDNFTMGIDDAVKAVELTNPKIAVPMHYNTFPIIKADPQEFKDKLAAKGKECLIMQPGDEIEI